VEQLYRRAKDRVSAILLGIYFPFTILPLLYFYFAIFLYYRTLGDNIFSRGGI